MLTLNQINKEVAKKYPHVKVVRGEEYFYLWSDDNATALMLAGLYDASIPVYRVNHMSLEAWLRSVDIIMTEDRNLRYK